MSAATPDLSHKVFLIIDRASGTLSDRGTRDMLFHFMGGLSTVPEVNEEKILELLEAALQAAHRIQRKELRSQSGLLNSFDTQE